MKNKNYITSYCKIHDCKIISDKGLIFDGEDSEFNAFSKTAYNHLGVNYTKFFKMDNVSKLAFLGAEVLLQNYTTTQHETSIALLFANKSSSLDTDVKHQSSISDKQNYFPSPAVFVYTLPNICLGEISIRHQLKSENSFFIFEAFNPLFMAGYADILLDTKKATTVLCGWVEYFEEEYNAFLYLVSKEGKIDHDAQTLELLYKS